MDESEIGTWEIIEEIRDTKKLATKCFDDLKAVKFMQKEMLAELVEQNEEEESEAGYEEEFD